jgi:hypothetical protein
MTEDVGSLTVAQVAHMLQAGQAVALLPDHFPGPVRLHGRWWHYPHTALDEGGAYEPAPAALAQVFTRQHARLADAGVTIGPTPTGGDGEPRP